MRYSSALRAARVACNEPQPACIPFCRIIPTIRLEFVVIILVLYYVHPSTDSHTYSKMAKRTVKAGITGMYPAKRHQQFCSPFNQSRMLIFLFLSSHFLGKYGVRYGSSLRRQIKKIEVSQHSRYTCTFCGKDTVKRQAVGIWECKSCKKVIAGGAWTVSTTAAATVRSTIRRLREMTEA